MPPNDQRPVLTVEGFRALYRETPPDGSRDRSCVALEESVAGRTGPIALRRYLPTGGVPGPQPAILFFHGGGWVAGGLDSHDDLCRRMLRATGIQVIAVDYRLAPENPYPAAVEDAIDAHAMLLQRAAEWGVDVDAIAVMGDGAGGTLASVVALHARDMCMPVPIAQLLFYPITDLTRESESFRRVDGVPVTGALVRWVRDQYMPHDADVGDWRASPLHAHSLAGLPPSFISVAGRDPLHDEAVAFAERLRSAGVEVSLRQHPREVRNFLLLREITADTDDTIAAAAAFLETRIRITV